MGVLSEVCVVARLSHGQSAWRERLLMQALCGAKCGGQEFVPMI